MSDWHDLYDGPEDEDPISMSPEVEEILLGPDTPLDIVGAVSVVMVEMREALGLGVLPLSARPVPGVDDVYTSFMPHGLGLIEYHRSVTPKGAPGFYIARVVRFDDYPTGF
ncbi:hypothetical protein GCM10020367_17450 [Streptomyces sannanensis]|uniref:Uncharacterized protein n=1 Tax=Streptomyces sannanensis TaxID=285536 RepID=A0ABP6S826_9ACTN